MSLPEMVPVPDDEGVCAFAERTATNRKGRR